MSMSCSSDFRTVSDPDAVYRLDEGFKASSYLTETLLDPEFGHAYESNKTAFNKAHNVKEDLWTWFEAPGNELRLTRFGAAMNGLKNMSPVEAILEGSFRMCGACTPPCHIWKHCYIGRVRLGTAPRGLVDRRRWRRPRLAVLSSCQASPTASLRCPRPRACCARGSRGMCIVIRPGCLKL